MDRFPADVRFYAIHYDLAAVVVSPSDGLFLYFFVFICSGNRELNGLFCPVRRFCISTGCVVDSVRYRDRIPRDQGQHAHRIEWIANCVSNTVLTYLSANFTEVDEQKRCWFLCQTLVPQN